jgi:predicted nucleic acid-binding protein
VSCVVDCSVVVPYLLGAATEPERAGILDGAQAPALLDVEVTHALRGLVRGRKLELDRAEHAREDLGLLAVRRYADTAVLGRAWDLRDVCTTHDGLYVALAEALDVPLLTRDAPLARGVEGLIEVRLAAG